MVIILDIYENDSEYLTNNKHFLIDCCIFGKSNAIISISSHFSEKISAKWAKGPEWNVCTLNNAIDKC